MPVYVDASVVVRALLTDEPEWERCADLLTSGDHLLVTAPWTRVECERALRIAARDGRLADVADAIASLHSVLDTFALVSPPHEQLVQHALYVVERHLLRTLDAMHLAAALIFTEATHLGAGLAFAAVDGQLATAAAQEGMVWPDAPT